MAEVINEVIFNRAQYHPGEKVKIEIVINLDEIVTINEDFITVEINDLEKVLYKSDLGLNKLKKNSSKFQIQWVIPATGFQGLGLDINYISYGRVLDYYYTGFDIVEEWSQAPRYGFLATFEPEKDFKEIDQRLKIMNNFHLNMIQFYDWMYRHHQLIPETEEFKDIFDRPLSIRVVKKQIDGCREQGMLPVAYGAIYGAEEDFVRKHPDWIAATRNRNGKNRLLDEHPNYIQIMNIAEDCPWRVHIVNEFAQAIEGVGFAGIHLDQYGFPKSYYSTVDGKNELKDTGEEFGSFIEYTRKKLGNKVALIFNAVNNWPVEIVASKPQDVVYIEVWSPYDTFHHLRQLILRARELSGYKKQVILAAYISSLNKEKDIPREAGERAARLTAASIFANGGFHLVMGEGAAMLTGPYYPEFRKLSPRFSEVMKRYYDVITRYSHYLFSPDLRDRSAVLTGGINDEIKLLIEGKEIKIGPNGERDSIWTIVRENKRYKVLNLVNLLGIDTVNWDEPQFKEPVFQENLEIEWLIDEDVEGIYWITPDGGDIRPEKLDFSHVSHRRGEVIKFIVPELEYWGFAVIKIL